MTSSNTLGLPEPETYYHATTADAAASIIRQGFRDDTGSYGLVDFNLTGVFLSDVPLGDTEGTSGRVLLRVSLPHGRIDMGLFEILEEGKPYRECCVPARLINELGVVEASIRGEMLRSQQWRNAFRGRA